MPIVTAVFDDRDTAERAAQALVFRFQIDRADVFAADSSNDPDGQVAWQRLASRGIPQADRHFFHEAVTRGNAVVVADVDAAHAEEAMDALESHGAVDLDDRENAFRSAGWTGMSAYGDDAVFTGGSAAGMAATPPTSGDAASPPGSRPCCVRMGSRRWPSLCRVAGFSVFGDSASTHPALCSRAARTTPWAPT